MEGIHVLLLYKHKKTTLLLCFDIELLGEKLSGRIDSPKQGATIQAEFMMSSYTGGTNRRNTWFGLNAALQKGFIRPDPNRCSCRAEEMGYQLTMGITVHILGEVAPFSRRHSWPITAWGGCECWVVGFLKLEFSEAFQPSEKQFCNQVTSFLLQL